MKMNPIQFQPGLSLNKFLELYGSQEQCEALVESARCPSGFTCAKCGSTRHSSYRRGVSVIVFHCSDCRTQITLTEGTLFHSTNCL